MIFKGEIMTKLETESTGVDINLKTADPDTFIEALQSEASRQLKKILAQKKVIKDVKSNIDLLMARYHVDESLFGQAALWYGNLSWWVKLSHITAIGAICWASIVLGLVIFVVYSTLALLFTDYYNVSEKRDKRLCEDIVALEKSMAESVEHISSIEDSLTKVFTSLCEMNIEQANDIAVFKAQISQLETQIQLLNAITTKVSQTKDSLADSTAKISQSFEKATLNFDDLNESISSTLGDLEQTDEVLSHNIDLLADDHKLLSEVNVKFDESSAHLTILAGNLSKLLVQLKARVEVYESSHETPCKTTAPVDIVSAVETKDMIAHADDTVADALKVLEEYQREQERADINASYCETGKNGRSSNVATLLARAKNAISSQVKPGTQGLGAYSILFQ